MMHRNGTADICTHRKGGDISILNTEEFESRYGNLQSQYNDWRRKAEDSIREGRGKKHPEVYFTDCGFAEARESFSEYCGLEEIIPFDVMLQYENQFPDCQLL